MLRETVQGALEGFAWGSLDSCRQGLEGIPEAGF